MMIWPRAIQNSGELKSMPGLYAFLRQGGRAEVVEPSAELR